MLQSNLPCAFTSKKQADRHGCGVHALTMRAGAHSQPLHLVFQLPWFGNVLLHWFVTGLFGQIWMVSWLC